MCTLILGRDVLDPGSFVVGANRDESPNRAAESPLRLSGAQHIVGGRDLRGGGTWLAIRDARSVVAVLNRRGAHAALAERPRSRGLLALDVACAAPGAAADLFAREALSTALSAVSAQPYAPFSLVCATPSGGWVLAHDGVRPAEPREIEPGWHVLTHGELDDAKEPRTVRLARKLAGFRPRTTGEVETKVLELLSLHGTFGEGTPPEANEPEPEPAAIDRAAVCVHQGRMVTVSTSLFRLSRGGTRYIHIDGRPCTTPPRDLSPLLAP